MLVRQGWVYRMADWPRALLEGPGASFLSAGSGRSPGAHTAQLNGLGSSTRGQGGAGSTWGAALPLLDAPSGLAHGGGAGVRERGSSDRRVGCSEGMGSLVGSLTLKRALLFSLPAVVNSTGGSSNGGGIGLTLGGTMGSNALSFSSSAGPGPLKAYSIRTTSTSRRSARN